MHVISLLAVCVGAAIAEVPTRIIATGGQAVRSVAWSPDGRSFAAAANGVRTWSAESLESLMNTTSDDIINAVAYSPDSSLLISSGARTIHGLDAESGAVLQSFKGHTDYTYEVALSGDGRLATTGDRTMRVWDMASGEQLLQTNNCPSFCSFPPSMYAVAFSPDGSKIASGAADGSVMIRDASDGSLLQQLFDHSDMVVAVMFSPDGDAFASAAFDGTVRITEVSSGKVLRVLDVGGASVWSVVYSSDGKHLAAAGSGGMIHLWDTATWTMSSLEGHRGSVRSVVFSPRGDRLLSSDENGWILLWPLNLTDAVLV